MELTGVGDADSPAGFGWGSEGMRTLGIWLVALGMSLLTPGVFVVASVTTVGELIGCLTCLGLVPIVLICIGVTLVRRKEDLAWDEESLNARPAVPEGSDLEILDRMRVFDLNRLNWIGWVLLIATFVFVVGEARAMVWLWPEGWDRSLAKMLAVPLVFLGIGFFVGAKWVLGLCGVSIYRRRCSRAEPEFRQAGGSESDTIPQADQPPDD